jgi:hypothetical protein
LKRRLEQTTRRLLPDADRVVVYRGQSFAFFTLLEHRELLLSLEGKARQRALAKARSLLHGEPPACLGQARPTLIGPLPYV